MEVAIWDDPALSGAVVMVCLDCDEDVPEHTLWDVSNIDVDHPNLPDSHPLEDGEEWVIQNRYEDRDTYLMHLEASWDGKFPEETDDFDVPDGDCWDIFVYDGSDGEAVEEARDALRSRLN
jgi:hypothetical protein